LWRDSSNVAIWTMAGSGIASTAGLGKVPISWTIVGQRDFNGDGYADILWRNSTTGQVFIWLMNGATIIGGGPEQVFVPTNLIIAGTDDFNGDGMSDILWYNTTTGQVALWFMNGASMIGGGSPGAALSPWTIAGASTAARHTMINLHAAFQDAFRFRKRPMGPARCERGHPARLAPPKKILGVMRSLQTRGQQQLWRSMSALLR
jgi:hypothetical protein